MRYDEDELADREEHDRETAKDEKADRRFHSIRDGDEECFLCGRPSYSVLAGNVYCKRCWEDTRPCATTIN